MTQRPKLCEVPIWQVLPVRQGKCYCTMSVGQWDGLLQSAYEAGYVLIELDDDEKPVRTYQRQAQA